MLNKTITHLSGTSQAKLGLSALLFIFVLSGCSSLPSNPTKDISISNTPTEELQISEQKPDALKPFLEKISKDHQIPLAELNLAFEDAKSIPSIRKLVLPPPPGFQKNWKVYRSRFVEPKRLAAGQQFWAKHQSFIKEVSQQTGVPPEIIVAIIGVETIYGKQMGTFSTKDTLITLGFQYPNTPNRASRETLFKNQLEDLILLCWQENPKSKLFKSCLNQTGSYAGAIGLPQFMPSSIRKFGIDGDKDGKIDLRNSPEDAIASVGNFLKMHGWVKDEPVYLKMMMSNETLAIAQKLADGEPKAKLQLGQLIKEKIIESSTLPESTPSLVVDLPSPTSNGETEVQYVIGLRNFIAICDYNRSFFYAQSVAEFADALRGTPLSEATIAKKSVKKTKKPSKKASAKKSKNISQANQNN
ncbi:lytic murein transglycosylase B [Polynucleobacter sp. MWH-Spelu-300-X4]|uniref:lytic murein transglycosylase B n=1 Tax=Polynucleobacter sp. MWH-Spelu-300-X4 TaxID=2689109 RepID=UPI001BFDE626|nr:lytic murein transglycosylase B [Polynucleobacter sp. MWH-Spelu-300-X4]QWD80239.1 lytic murein transglycosylase B [Polynucleobacter sp. MWH-Spelu-300-X4]